MENKDIAQIFTDIADILEIQDKDPFRIRAYRKAAMNIEDMSEKIEYMFKQDAKRLDEIPGVGASLREKVKEILTTGKLKQREDLMKEVPPQLLELMHISSLGPKTVQKLHKKLRINNIRGLEEACKKHKVRTLEGMGVKSEEKILESISEFKTASGRMKLEQATFYARGIIEHLRKLKSVKRAEPAGSLRRGLETVGDIDILVTGKYPDKIMAHFVDYPQTKKVLAHGESKSSIILKGGIQIDVRFIEEDRFGSALQYFTGSKAHNIKTRTIAIDRGYKLNEYGLFKGKRRLAGKTEEEVYKALGLTYIPPELREDRGEIEAAKTNSLPRLVEERDIKGDLHLHTKATDGANTIEEMARAAMKKGYKYIAITDHSKAVRVAGGLNDEETIRHIDEIKKINRKMRGITIFAGMEVDILGDGGLDLSADVLKKLDLVIAAVHSKFNLDKDKMTKRIIRAMENPYVNVLAHPTGRLIGERKPYEIDFARIFEKASENGIMIEVNCYSSRLDLKDVHCKMAKEYGAKIVISTDAHNTLQLDNMHFGVVTARRGWLEKKDVANTLPVEKFKKLIKR